MTPLQWSVIDALRGADRPMVADDIGVRMRAQGHKFADGKLIGGALSSLRRKGVLRRKSIPTNGKSSKAFQFAWSLNPQAELPPRQETLL